MSDNHKPKAYWNPYLGGIALGLVLLFAFVSVGRGLGASGALTRGVAFTSDKIASEATHNNKYLNKYLPDTEHPLDDFLVYMLVGVFVGGILSGALGNRIAKEIIKGPRATNKTRLILAFIGGIVAAIGVRLANGCTSGQALTGGATLAVGSWAFMIAVFAGGYMMAYFLRRQWL